MIKFENVEVVGFEHAIRGMRNPMNSWDKSDSYKAVDCGKCGKVEREVICEKEGRDCSCFECYALGSNDLDLMQRLRAAGTEHRKYLRMIVVYVDITAPLYWWKEFDTYKVGTVANSCSTMHKIAAKEFTLDDFSHEHLIHGAKETLCKVIDVLNFWRELYIGNTRVDELQSYRNFEKKDFWWQMIQLLPSSYNQKRTVMLNYEVLNSIYKQRKNHKLDEWSGRDCFKDLVRNCSTCVKMGSSECHGGKDGGFIQWIETLPYAKELITGEV